MLLLLSPGQTKPKPTQSAPDTRNHQLYCLHASYVGSRPPAHRTESGRTPRELRATCRCARNRTAAGFFLAITFVILSLIETPKMITFVIMEIKGHTIRVDDEVWEKLNGLPGSMNEGLRALLINPTAADSPALLEVLEHVRSMAASLPSTEDMYEIVGHVVREQAPLGIPGVQLGATAAQAPRRETGSERAARETRERGARAAAMDPVSDPSIDRSDEFVSQA